MRRFKTFIAQCIRNFVHWKDACRRTSHSSKCTRRLSMLTCKMAMFVKKKKTSWMKPKTKDSDTCCIHSSIHTNQRRPDACATEQPFKRRPAECQDLDWTWFNTKPSWNQFQIEKTSQWSDSGHRSNVSAIESAATIVRSVNFLLEKQTLSENCRLRVYKAGLLCQKQPNVWDLRSIPSWREQQKNGPISAKNKAKNFVRGRICKICGLSGGSCECLPSCEDDSSEGRVHFVELELQQQSGYENFSWNG